MPETMDTHVAPPRDHGSPQPPADQPEPRTDVDEGSLGFWERASFSLAHSGASALLFILSLRGLHQFGRALGTLEWLINYKRRRRFVETLHRVFGRPPDPRERRREGREFFMRSRCDKLFYLVFDRIPREQAMQLLTIVNQPLLDDAVSRGRGVYVALSHHGAHHVVGMLMGLRGYKTAGVRDRREGGLRKYIQRRFDERYPEFQRARVLYSDSYPREIYRCLQEGYLLGSAMDVSRVRDPRQRMEEVTLFGQKQLFLSGPLRVAVRCRAPIVQAFIVPESGYHYRLEFLDLLLDPEAVTDEEMTVAQAMRAYAANLERYLRTYPSLMTRT